MERAPVVNAPEAGPTAYAASRDASLSQLEGFTAEARALNAERIALGNSAAERKRKEAIAERLGDLKDYIDAIRICLDGDDYIRTRRAGVAVTLPSVRTYARKRLLLQHQCHCSSSPPRLRALRCPTPSSSLSGQSGGVANPLT